MASRLARLFARRSSRRDTVAIPEPIVAGVPASADDEEPQPAPVLLPAAIFRQVLMDPIELPPAWLKRRPPGLVPSAAPGLGTTGDELPTVDAATSKDPEPPKQARRRKATASSAPTPTRAKRVAKRPKAHE